MSTTPGPHAEPAKAQHHQSFWLWVMCLTGVDYFSTLGYQPSIAYENAGLLAPVATVVLVLVTLFGALPIYAYVAARSHAGQGSIGMLARLVSGWWGKMLVLVLLGFAATDFVITKTLSAADAAAHLITNPHWPLAVADDAEKTRQAVYVTSFLLVLLGASYCLTITHALEEVPPPWSGRRQWTSVGEAYRNAGPWKLGLMVFCALTIYVVVELISAPRLFAVQLEHLHRLLAGLPRCSATRSERVRRVLAGDVPLFQP